MDRDVIAEALAVMPVEYQTAVRDAFVWLLVQPDELRPFVVFSHVDEDRAYVQAALLPAGTGDPPGGILIDLPEASLDDDECARAGAILGPPRQIELCDIDGNVAVAVTYQTPVSDDVATAVELVAAVMVHVRGTDGRVKIERGHTYDDDGGGGGGGLPKPFREDDEEVPPTEAWQ